MKYLAEYYLCKSLYEYFNNIVLQVAAAEEHQPQQTITRVLNNDKQNNQPVARR